MSNLLAVYGSLRKGKSNAHLLEGAEWLGEGLTLPKYCLNGRMVFHHPAIAPVLVDLYRVDDSHLRATDALEGRNYARRPTFVRLRDKATAEQAWMYFCANAAYVVRCPPEPTRGGYYELCS